MTSQNDSIYFKLRPPAQTSSDEICHCTKPYPVMLQANFSYNPVSCIFCNLEVPPERLKYSEKIAEKIAFWRDFHFCFFWLWIDSAEFEEWAEAQLEAVDSPVTQRGRELVSEMNRYRRTYYWWFRADDDIEISDCPICSLPMSTAHGQTLCEPCSIVVPM